MIHLILADGPLSDEFFPFVLTRSVADMRCGILTIREKWAILLQQFNTDQELTISSNIIPNYEFIEGMIGNKTAAAPADPIRLHDPTDLLRLNASEITRDFSLITNGRQSAAISETNKITGTNIFLEKGAIVEHAYLNSTDGPIYIGRDAVVMEGSMIRGPFALGEKGIVKMGAKIYGATSAGPACVLGGEIKNCIFFGYSNKGHDGYLGDSVIGEWCNIGGGSSNSNIKNSAGDIKLWNPLTKRNIRGGEKCGLFMGDYSRAAINTSFNTGTVIGVCCHVFGNGFTPSYLPSFSWGYNLQLYEFDKAMLHINKWKKLKNQELSREQIHQLKIIFDQQNNNS